MIPSDTPLLIISCDKYADLWAPFFTVFWNHWPDCPYQLLLGSNHKTYSDPRVTPLSIGLDTSWTSGVLRMLDRIDAEYVLVFLEDFMIQKSVETAEINRLIRIAQQRRLGCLRLAAGLPLAFSPTRPVEGVPGLGIIERGELYRVSAQAAIWRVETLRKVLVPGLSAWQFESIGSELSNTVSEEFWGAYEPKISYVQAVEKGKWKPEGLAVCRRAGARVDLTVRSAFSEGELEQYYLKNELTSRQWNYKRNAILDFRSGRRWEGARQLWRYLSIHPFSVDMWLIGLLGLTVPRSIGWIQLQYLRWRVIRARWSGK